MKRFFQEASEAEEIPYESKQSQHWRRTRLTSQGLTTSVTTSTSPWMDTNRSPDTSFVNTVTQATLPVVQAKKDPHSTYISVLTRSMSPTDKVDSWFSSTPAGPSQSSTSRPNTRDTAMTSIAGEQSQPSNQTTGETFLGPTTTGASPQDLFLDSFVDNQSQLPDAQMDANITVPGSLNTNLSRPSISGLGTRDSFFDSVPKGPSQLSTSRWNARAPTFNPWNSTRKQAPTSPCNKPETSVIREQRNQENCRPQLTLRIPNTCTGSDVYRSAPQMATHSEIPDPRADAPRTTGSLIPAARLPNSVLQGPQQQTSLRGDMLNPAARPFQSKFSGCSHARAPGTSHAVMPTAASHTNSRTWTSNLVLEKERWQRVEDSLGKMNLLRSSVVPKTMKDWLAHKRGNADARKKREQRKLDDMNPSLRDPRLPPPGRPVKIGAAFRGEVFENVNYVSVLVFPSIWARTYQPSAKRPDPSWPCPEEMKEEGDERNTSGFRRFPALPRVPGNETVQYKLKPIQPFLPFDAVWKLPTRKSVEAANEKYAPEETEKMKGYLGRSLLEALDCITEDSY